MQPDKPRIHIIRTCCTRQRDGGEYAEPIAIVHTPDLQGDLRIEGDKWDPLQWLGKMGLCDNWNRIGTMG